MAEKETRLLMLVDDEPAQCRLVSAIAGRAGWRTIFARDAETAIAMLGTQDGMMLDAILLDQWVPGSDASTLIAELKSRRPALPVLLMTAIGSTDSAIEAMRAGASDYIIKPVAAERLIAALSLAAEHAKDFGELQPLTEKISQSLAFDEIVGAAPALRTALAIAAKAARSKAPVFIQGEAGVGKEVVADAVHAASPRARAPFLKVNCAAIAPNLLESVLFGHEKNAFTGAFDRRVGILQQADGGTVFLDEIDHLPSETQIRLVRLLTEGEIQPLGSAHSYRIDVRLITACNRSLSAKLADGSFREDLFYRINVVQLLIPPLRERTVDIPALARHFLGRMATQPGLRSLGITEEALALLRSYDWPGNVRQLQSALFRAAVLCERDALTPDEFPQIAAAVGRRTDVVSNHNEGIGVALYEQDGNMRPLEEIEADVIRLAIGHYRGRMTEVARRLGIGRSTLYRKLADLGIESSAA
ncbi:sigma-54-dependent transcriptional regulator [Sphingorhabdus sp.]|jgi:DNA-binding NtrC family response regulator|uniref:sigma-54-dependent transcriptional regulator n=1 Tax=Sphingorhabdus sp. TaxID=1902408 RepID=UPI0035AE21E6|nr:sigma-54-dependent Fis family transcriptional regulator [Sphingomonadaceae bacterium]